MKITPFTIFFRFLNETKYPGPERLDFECIDRPMIERFMEWLEFENNSSVSTRNQRLAAIHAFMKYVMAHAPEFYKQCREIREIPAKKATVKPPVYLSIEELQCIFRQPDQSTKQGIRDLALLTLLYDSGCRRYHGLICPFKTDNESD